MITSVPTVQQFEIQEETRPIRTEKGNGFQKWSMGFMPGFIFGICYLILTIALVAIEVSRIFLGSLNRLPNGNYNLYPGNLYLSPNFDPTNSFNIERQHQYLWPWSHPALLFAIPMFLACIFGISSGRRGTYSTIYLFFAFSLISFLLTPFLIGYFSVNISRHRYGNTNYQNDYNAHRDRDFSIVLLVISIVLLIVSLIAAIVAGIGFNCCTPKGGSYLTPLRKLRARPIPRVVNVNDTLK
jgi:MFS family permease